ncbi:Cof-type HAD-IIB family hydrolase [Lacticigenium naphthae]|uniref:Cof-type HAD-IIB family hydrolase n=1 Tax=Lacticigenium naphthae TaxID=515351 RepID=UPI00041E0B89|nr:Cof-type HAD-IIB family hydrolase [Lacticigenium naphthae]
MVKLIFFDIDGTLVTQQNKIPSSTKKAIRQLKEKGIVPIIATGRAPVLLEEIRKELEIDSFVAMNGQYIMLEGKVFYKNPLEYETVDKLVQFAAIEKDGVVLCTEDEILGNSIAQIMRRGSLLKVLRGIGEFIPGTIIFQIARKVRHRAVKEEIYRDKTIYQVIIQAQEEKDAHYRSKFPDLHFTRANRFGMDVISEGMSKAAAIEKILTVYSVTSDETVAFGDGLNDVEMLKFVGRGVAMGNGHEAAKNAAYLTADTANNDGIYKALKELKIL